MRSLTSPGAIEHEGHIYAGKDLKGFSRALNGLWDKILTGRKLTFWKTLDLRIQGQIEKGIIVIVQCLFYTVEFTLTFVIYYILYYILYIIFV